MIQEWQRPETTRRYLHPPMAERMYTIWREGKIILGEVEVLPGPIGKPYEDLESCGIWFCYGKNQQQADFHTARTLITEDGVPVHALENIFGSLKVTIEAFTDIGRKPTCFLKITLTNPTSEAIRERFGLLLRSGKEAELVFASPDVYASYLPDIQDWKNMAPSWQLLPACDPAAAEGIRIWRDRRYYLTASGDCDLLWTEQDGYIATDVYLANGEEKALYLSLGIAEEQENIPGFSYNKEKEACSSWWRQELSRIKRLPKEIAEDPEQVKMIRHLTAQLLQCFCKPVGEDYVLCRQGGLQRFIWPFEAMSVLEALDCLGDFDPYIEPVLAMYFDVLQAPDGEIVTLGLHWANCTAMVLYSFAAYTALTRPSFYHKYREKAMAAFRWIKATRASTIPNEHVLAGLFPPKRSCDDELVLQAWGGTDGMNLIGLRKYLETVTAFDDPYAAEIREEYDSYYAVLRSCYDLLLEQSEGSKELAVPTFPPGVKGKEDLFAFQPPFSYIAYVVDATKTETDRMLTYLNRIGSVSHGLYTKMPDTQRADITRRTDADGVVRIWYTTAREYYWFLCFLRLGEKERALEILDATLRYSMSPEYAMLERYHERDPFYAPWSPNASANGRLLLMLLAYYA